MIKVAFYTLGCKVNQYETALIREQFLKNRYKVVPFSQQADIYVINTCTVTSKSDRKSRYYIQSALRKSPQAKVIVTGCYVNRAPHELNGISPHLLAIPNQEKEDILNYLIPKNTYHQLKTINSFSGHSRAFVKIQDGCDSFCSYCIVPYVRNVLYSRPLEEILEEVKHLVDNGYKEIVLTGIRLGKFRIQKRCQMPDISLPRCNRGYQNEHQKNDLVELIKLIHQIKNLERIRLSSIEPMDITDELIDVFGDLPKLCCHLHIPLQSGDDNILENMNRKYTAKTYSTLIDKIRKKAPDVNITTDIIVGFPTETEENFNNTYKFIKNMGFGKLHIFKFSPREGTKASELPNQPDAKTKQERSKKLLDLSKQLTKEFYTKFINETLEVLIENKNKKTNLLRGFTPLEKATDLSRQLSQLEANGSIKPPSAQSIKECSSLTGFTDNYIRVVINDENISCGDLVKVNITNVDDDSAYGEVAR